MSIDVEFLEQVYQRFNARDIVEPTAFSTGADGETIVEVHQTVRDLQGAVLVDQMVGHIFRIENGASTSARREGCREFVRGGR